MKCPKCREAMEVVVHDGVAVDRCTGCRGLWFDRGEDEKLRKSQASEVLDDGDASVGKQYNQQARVDCPRCRSRMIRMVYAPQPHIWYESCGSCGGVWFDAGEFRDSLHVSFFDLFRDWFSRPRT